MRLCWRKSGVVSYSAPRARCHEVQLPPGSGHRKNQRVQIQLLSREIAAPLCSDGAIISLRVDVFWVEGPQQHCFWISRSIFKKGMGTDASPTLEKYFGTAFAFHLIVVFIVVGFKRKGKKKKDYITNYIPITHIKGDHKISGKNYYRISPYCGIIDRFCLCFPGL